MFLFITWVAVRLGTRGTVIALNVTAIQALLSAYHGVGFFANDIAQTHLVSCWFYTLILSVVGMALATFLAERNQSEKELQRFFNLVPDMVCIASTDGYFKKINRAWQTTLGYTEQEILSTPFLDLIHPDDRGATMEEVAWQVADRKTFRFSNRYRCKDGSYKWLEWDTIPPVDGTLLFGSARDITERKKAEEAVRASEARLQEIINLMPVALFIKDPASNIILMNRACEEQWGMSFSDLRGTDASQFFPHEQMAFFLDRDREVFANRQLIDFEETAWSASWRENRIMHTYKKPVFDEAGNPLYLIGMSIDITERKQAEEVSRWAKLVLDTTIDGFWMADMMGNLQEANAAYARISGYSVDELTGMHISQLEAIEKSKEQIKAHAEKIIAQGSDLFETRHRRKDGNEIDIEVSANFMPETQRFFVFLRDITGRKAAEQKLRNLSAHMLNVREEEKASIAREIHDDLGGTLAAVKMDTYWLSRKLPVNEETAPLLERIKSMSQLIDNAVDVTRRVISDLRPTMLDDLGLLAALEWQCTQFHKHTDIECRIRCIEDEGDLDKQHSIALLRIFQEALTNVARHSGASRVEVEFRHDDEEAFLSINDNGRGLPEDSAVAAGSYGILGMTERVEQLGGKIKFDSQPGSGLRVTVALPLPADN